MAKSKIKLPVIGKVSVSTLVIAAAAAYFLFIRKPSQPALPQ